MLKVKQWRCLLCGYWSWHRAELEAHYKDVHAKVKP